MDSRFAVNPSILAVGSVVVAFGAGVGAGYLVFKKKFEDFADEEIAEFKLEYMARQDAIFASREKALLNDAGKEEINKVIGDLKYTSSSPEPEQVEETVEPVNVFDDAKAVPDWDQDVEEATRTTKDIYIVSYDEFYRNDPEHQQTQWAYYTEDDVLSDQHDQAVLDVVTMVGEDCLFKFGYGSGDRDTVFVRNETLQTDYEITRTDGKYSEVVLGLGEAEDIEHSSRRPKKFRSYHDE